MTNFIGHLVRAGVLAIALGSVALAQLPATTQPLAGNIPGTNEFVAFDQFIANTSAAAFNSAARKVANAGVFKVADPDAFTEMRQHVMNLYQGVHVTHSFMQGAQTYDCIPIEQQPSLRMLGAKGIAAPPAAVSANLPSTPAAGAAPVLEQFGEATQASLLPTTAVDRFGNPTACEDHTVPIQRTTVDQMSRFATLRAFLSKSPDGQGTPPVPPKDGGALTSTLAPPSFGFNYHDYMHQTVYNLGGNSNINIWDPGVATIWGQVMSLSQVWYLGVSAKGAVQSVEAGWQVYPGRLGDANPHLFVYFTPDGYNTGCYDHVCIGFVQSSSRIFPGAALPRSLPSGNQTEIGVQWLWFFGNWWLNVNGEWVGYYPGSLFGTGDMATHSSSIWYGGEILAGNGTSYDYNPEMGSGWFASYGYGVAAYQRRISYFDANGAWQSPSLTQINECPAGTSMSGPNDGGSSWGIYFFFGGPGGYCP